MECWSTGVLEYGKTNTPILHHSSTPISHTHSTIFLKLFLSKKTVSPATATCYLVTLIPEVISNIGSKIAMTMNPTTTPMKRITIGSMIEVSEAMVASTSSS